MDERWGGGLAAWMGGMGLEAAQRLGRLVGHALWWALPGRRGMACAAVARRLGLAPEAARAVARASFVHAGMAFAEILAGRGGPRLFQERVTVERPDLLARLAASARPVVAASGHLGAWELLVAVGALFPHRPGCQVVVRLPKARLLRGLLLHARTGARLQAVGHRDASAGVLATLRAGGMAAFLVDHHCRRAEAERLPFLGREASVNRGPALLAVRARAEVWPLFLVREPGAPGRFRLLLEPPLDTRELAGTVGERVRAVCAFTTAAVERAVRRYPEQWFWMHRRWKL